MSAKLGVFVTGRGWLGGGGRWIWARTRHSSCWAPRWELGCLRLGTACPTAHTAEASGLAQPQGLRGLSPDALLLGSRLAPGHTSLPTTPLCLCLVDPRPRSTASPHSAPPAPWHLSEAPTPSPPHERPEAAFCPDTKLPPARQALRQRRSPSPTGTALTPCPPARAEPQSTHPCRRWGCLQRDTRSPWPGAGHLD